MNYTKNKLSVIIPSRQEQYLNATINDLLKKAEEEVEVIVVLDGYWVSSIVEDKRVLYIHHGLIHENKGMRAGINKGVALSTGEYIMKIDEHCLMDQGYDRKLKADCEDNWVVIPRRYRLDAENWKVLEDGRVPVDYMYIEYPYAKPLDKTQGLHGAEWKRPERKDILIDDSPTMQGSCYFMKHKYWDNLFPNGLDDKNYGTFTQEAQEISMATWLSGGRFIVNKKTFYAHMHKGRSGKGYNFTTEQYKKHSEMNEIGRLYCINKWLYTKEYKYDFDWFINIKFPTMPGWSGDWRKRLEEDKHKDYSTTGYKNDFWLSNLRK